MQTFIPYFNIKKTAKILDYRRLGKQRVESKQILECLLGKSNLRWKNHPAVKMWQGYESALCLYSIEICNEWIKRGYKDSLLPYFTNELKQLNKYNKKINFPKWWKKQKVSRSHRCNLLRKDYNYYKDKFHDTNKLNINENYIWII